MTKRKVGDVIAARALPPGGVAIDARESAIPLLCRRKSGTSGAWLWGAHDSDLTSSDWPQWSDMSLSFEVVYLGKPRDFTPSAMRDLLTQAGEQSAVAAAAIRAQGFT